MIFPNFPIGMALLWRCLTNYTEIKRYDCILWTKISLELNSSMSKWNSPSLLCKSGRSRWKHAEDKSFITRGEKRSPTPPPPQSCQNIFANSYFLSFCREFVLQPVSGALIQTFCLKTFHIFVSFICSTASVAASLWFPKNIWILRLVLLLSSYQTALTRISTVVWGCLRCFPGSTPCPISHLTSAATLPLLSSKENE